MEITRADGKQDKLDAESNVAVRSISWSDVEQLADGDRVRGVDDVDARESDASARTSSKTQACAAWETILEGAKGAAKVWADCEKEKQSAQASQLDKQLMDKNAKNASERLKRYLVYLDQVVGGLSTINIGKARTESDKTVIGELINTVCTGLIQFDGCFLFLGVDNFEVHNKAWKHCLALCVKHNHWAAPWLQVESLLLVAARYAEDGIATLEISLGTVGPKTRAVTPKDRTILTSAKFVKNNASRIGMMLRLARKIASSVPAREQQVNWTLNQVAPRLAFLFQSLEHICSRLLEFVGDSKLARENAIQETKAALAPCQSKLCYAIAGASFEVHGAHDANEQEKYEPLVCAVMREMTMSNLDIDLSLYVELWVSYAASMQSQLPHELEKLKFNTESVLGLAFRRLLAGVALHATCLKSLSGIMKSQSIASVGMGINNFVKYCFSAAGEAAAFAAFKVLFQTGLDDYNMQSGVHAWAAAVIGVALSRLEDSSLSLIMSRLLTLQACEKYQFVALNSLASDLGDHSMQSGRYFGTPWLTSLENYFLDESIFLHVQAHLCYENDLLRACTFEDKPMAKHLIESRKEGTVKSVFWGASQFGLSRVLERLPLQPSSTSAELFFCAVEQDLNMLAAELRAANIRSAQAVVICHTLTALAKAASFFASSIKDKVAIRTALKSLLNVLDALLITDLTNHGHQVKISARLALLSVLTQLSASQNGLLQKPLYSLGPNEVTIIFRSLSLKEDCDLVISEHLLVDLASILVRLEGFNPEAANDVTVQSSLKTVCHDLFRVTSKCKVGRFLAMVGFHRLASTFPSRNEAVLRDLLPSEDRQDFSNFLLLWNRRTTTIQGQEGTDHDDSLGSLKITTECSQYPQGWERSETSCHVQVLRKALSELDSATLFSRSSTNSKDKTSRGRHNGYAQASCGPAPGYAKPASFKRAWASLQALLRGAPPDGENRAPVLEKIQNASAQLVAASEEFD